MIPLARSPLTESLGRVVLGLYAVWDTTQRMLPLEHNFRPWSSLSILAALLLCVGWYERSSALALAAIWCWRPLAFDVWQLDAGLMLLFLVQACVPRAPYGTASVAGRADPRGGWQCPAWIHHARGAAVFFALPMLLLPAELPLDASQVWRVTQDTIPFLGMELGLLALCAACAFCACWFTRRALLWWWIALAVLSVVMLVFENDAEQRAAAGRLAVLLWISAPWEWIPARGPAAVERVRLAWGLRAWIAEDPQAERWSFDRGAPERGWCQVLGQDGLERRDAAAWLYMLQRQGALARVLGWLLARLPITVVEWSLRAAMRVWRPCPDAYARLPRALRSRFERAFVLK